MSATNSTRGQFTKVDCSRGAPMGRYAHGLPQNCEPRSVHLFKVKLDSGGYDDGGAYWGIGQPLYCARADEYLHFTRANSRKQAAEYLNLTNEQLRKKYT